MKDKRITPNVCLGTALHDNVINEIYLECYNIYKKDYANDKDFSIQSQDINEEIDEILTDYQCIVNRRNGMLSNSVYSELLNDLDISDGEINDENSKILPQKQHDQDFTNNLKAFQSEKVKPISEVNILQNRAMNNTVEERKLTEREIYMSKEYPKLHLPTLEGQPNTSMRGENNNTESKKGSSFNSSNTSGLFSHSEISQLSQIDDFKHLSNSMLLDENMTCAALAEKFFERIVNSKSINIKTRTFLEDRSYFDMISDDPFLVHFIQLISEANNQFFNEDFNQNLKSKFDIRYEVYFFELIRRYMDFKKEVYMKLSVKKIEYYKKEIITLVTQMDSFLNAQIFILSSNDFLILKPCTLLKLWNNLSEDNDVATYYDLNRIFLLKTYIKLKDYVKAYNEVKWVIDKPNSFGQAKLWVYYFGKVMGQIIEKVNEVKHPEIVSFLSNTESFAMIKKIMESYTSATNFRKIEKNLTRLAKIAEYYKVGAKIIEIYTRKAKKYKEFLNDANKILLTKESGLYNGGSQSSN